VLRTRRDTINIVTEFGSCNGQRYSRYCTGDRLRSQVVRKRVEEATAYHRKCQVLTRCIKGLKPLAIGTHFTLKAY